MPQFAQRLRFDLADALASDVEVLTHFFQRALVPTIVESEPQTNHTLFTRAQRLQNVAGDLTQVRRDHTRRRTLARLVFDQVAQLRITILTDRRLERDRILHQLARLADLLHRSIHLLRDLFSRPFAPELTHQFTRSVLQLIDHFDHVHRNTNRARL